MLKYCIDPNTKVKKIVALTLRIILLHNSIVTIDQTLDNYSVKSEKKNQLKQSKKNLFENSNWILLWKRTWNDEITSILCEMTEVRFDWIESLLCYDWQKKEFASAKRSVKVTRSLLIFTSRCQPWQRINKLYTNALLIFLYNTFIYTNRSKYSDQWIASSAFVIVRFKGMHVFFDYFLTIFFTIFRTWIVCNGQQLKEYLLQQSLVDLKFYHKTSLSFFFHQHTTQLSRWK